jgi:hypothetical protein
MAWHFWRFAARFRRSPILTSPQHSPRNRPIPPGSWRHLGDGPRISKRSSGRLARTGGLSQRTLNRLIVRCPSWAPKGSLLTPRSRGRCWSIWLHSTCVPTSPNRLGALAVEEEARRRGPRSTRTDGAFAAGEGTLQRCRSERLERPKAHLYETGGMRHTRLRGHANILKRVFVHTSGFQPGTLDADTLRRRYTARALGAAGGSPALIVGLWTLVAERWCAVRPPLHDHGCAFTPRHRFELLPVESALATDCQYLSGRGVGSSKTAWGPCRSPRRLLAPTRA